MSVYLSSIHSAVYIFPLIILLVSLPLFVLVYRKFGRFSLSRGIVLYAFIFYLLCAYFLVVLPLPPIEEVAGYTQPYIGYIPFSFIGRFIESSGFVLSDPSTYIPALCSNAFVEPVFNVFLTMPFGLFMRYYFKQPLKKTILYTFLLSLFFELTQLSGLYFIYPRPYRFADINDLITNTTGGYLGYKLAPAVSKILPQQTEPPADANVSLFRRLCALIIDWMLISTVNQFVDKLVPSENIVRLLEACAYFIGIQYMLKGRTLGKMLLRIRVVSERGGPPSLSELTRRYAPGYLVIYVPGFLLTDVPNSISAYGELPIWVNAVIGLVGICIQLAIVILILYYFITKKNRYIHEYASNTYTVPYQAKE